ncbi:hypothetical protein F2Q70_00005464 [Brassica cretica]|uniref:Uncharacterized protein n=1 Tax=Brassica cretica TaxID=69181 RepID=A0A8S9IUW5_BRACR|nr:hypothetical protein F2Q70_00005464 [Brassica cretica]
MEIIGNAHQLYDRKSLRATGGEGKGKGKGKGLTGLLPRIRVCEPGGVLTKLAKWNGLDTCHEDGWLRRVIQRCVGNVTNLPFDPEGIVCPTKCSAVVTVTVDAWTSRRKQIAVPANEATIFLGARHRWKNPFWTGMVDGRFHWSGPGLDHTC